MPKNAEFRYVTTQLLQTGSSPNPILAELPFTGVNFTQQLNSIGTFQGHVLLSGINTGNPTLDTNWVYNGTIPGKTILWVLYNNPLDFTVKPIWSGVIWQREYDSINQTLEITAQEMMSVYQKRRITDSLVYKAENPAVIAKDLLEYTEAKLFGNTGMTYSTVPVTVYSTTRTYDQYEYKPVYQAIKDLSNNYFDFKVQPKVDLSGYLVNEFQMGADFTTLGQPHIGAPYSVTDPDAIVFQFPANVLEYKFPEDATSAANVVYGLGNGPNSSKIIATYTDAAKYIDGFSLLEDSINYIDVGDIDMLKDLTEGYGNAISYPPTTIEIVLAPYVEPYFPTYKIGDEVRLDIKDDYFPNGISFGADGDPLRIVGISVNPGENGPSRVTLTLTRQLAAGTVE